MKTIKTIAMAIAMTIIGTATTYANNTVIKNNHHKPAAVVVVNNNHHHCMDCRTVHARDHRHMVTPVHNCMCKHCKKLRHAIEMEMRRREAHRHHINVVNAGHGHMNAYRGR